MENIITKIEVQKNNKNRVNIYINGEYALSCSTDLVYFHALKKGMKVEIDYLNKIVEDDNYLKCKNYALKFIEKSYKTESEIVKKLLEKGYNRTAIDKVILFLKKYKFVDDELYADVFIKQSILRFGKKKIKYKLLKKGIKEDIIDKKLDGISEECEMKSALKLAQKKFDLLVKSKNSKMNIYQKLGNFLLSNGYDFDVINKVLSKVVTNNSMNKIMETEELNNEVNEKALIEEQYKKLKELAQKRYNIITKSEHDKVKIYRRLYNYLLRRGYSSSMIKKAINEVV